MDEFIKLLDENLDYVNHEISGDIIVYTAGREKPQKNRQKARKCGKIGAR